MSGEIYVEIPACRQAGFDFSCKAGFAQDDNSFYIVSESYHSSLDFSRERVMLETGIVDGGFMLEQGETPVDKIDAQFFSPSKDRMARSGDVALYFRHKSGRVTVQHYCHDESKQSKRREDGSVEEVSQEKEGDLKFDWEKKTVA